MIRRATGLSPCPIQGLARRSGPAWVMWFRSYWSHAVELPNQRSTPVTAISSGKEAGT